jgi:hypothetical protein
MNERLLLEFEPSAGQISTVRRFIDEFFGRSIGETLSWQIALTTHELLENSMKYSLSGGSRLRIDIVREAETTVTVQTTNRARPADIEALELAFAEMETFADPFDYYQTLMARTARRPVGSGLGLARIRAEASMELSWELAGETVHLRASTRLNESIR